MTKYVLLGLTALVAGAGAGWAAAYAPLWRGVEQFRTGGLADADAAGSNTASSAPANTPQIQVVNGEDHTFGEMLVGGKRSHQFQIKNAGSAPLTLRLENTTCKCTISDLTSATVAPGEMKEVTLEWKAENLMPNFVQSAVIRTNDPRRPVVYLQVRGAVEQATHIVPGLIQFANVPADQAVERRLRVYATKQVPHMVVEGVDVGTGTLAEHLECEVRKLSDDELRSEPRAVGGHEVLVRLQPGLPTGALKGELRLALNVAEQPEVVVPILGNVISDISVLGRGVPYNSQANILSLGPIEQATGTTAELVVIIKGERREQVELEVAEVDPANVVRATLGDSTKTDKLVTVPLTIEIPAGAPATSRLGGDAGPSGRVLLRARNAHTSEIPIEIRFTVN